MLCGNGRFCLLGSAEELREAIYDCVTPKSGISSQYIYRSIYAAQISNCLKVCSYTYVCIYFVVCVGGVMI